MSRLVFKAGIHVAWTGDPDAQLEHKEYGAGTGLPIPPQVWRALQKNSENWSVSYVADSTTSGAKSWKEQREQAQQYAKTPVYFFTDKQGKPGYTADLGVAKHYGNITRGTMADIWEGRFHSYNDDGDIVDNDFDYNDISEHLEGGVIRANKDASHRSLLAEHNKQHLRYQELYAKARGMKYDMKTRGGGVEFVESAEGKYSLLPLLHFANITNNSELMESLAAGIEGKGKGKKMTRAISPRDMFGRDAQHKEQGMSIDANQFFARDAGLISKILNVRNLRQVEDTVKELYKGYYDSDMEKKESVTARNENPVARTSPEQPRLQRTAEGLTYNGDDNTSKSLAAFTKGIDSSIVVERGQVDGRLANATGNFRGAVVTHMSEELFRDGVISSKVLSGAPSNGKIEGKARQLGLMGSALAFLDAQPSLKDREFVSEGKPHVVLHGALHSVLGGKPGVDVEAVSQQLHRNILAGATETRLPTQLTDAHFKDINIKDVAEVKNEMNRRLTALRSGAGMKVQVSGKSMDAALDNAGLAMYAAVVSADNRRADPKSAIRTDSNYPDFESHANYAARQALESFIQPLLQDTLHGSVVYMGESQAVDVGAMLSMARLLPIEKKDGHYVIDGKTIPVDGGNDSENPLSIEDRRSVVRSLMSKLTSGKTTMGEAFTNLLKNLQHSSYGESGGGVEYPVPKDIKISNYDDSADVDHGMITSITDSIGALTTEFSSRFLQGATSSTSNIDLGQAQQMARTLAENKDSFMAKLPDLMHNSISGDPQLMEITNAIMEDIFTHVGNKLSSGSIDQVGNYFEKMLTLPALANAVRNYKKQGLEVQIVNTRAVNVGKEHFNTIRNRINLAKEEMNGGRSRDDVESSLYQDMMGTLSNTGSNPDSVTSQHVSHSFFIVAHEGGKLKHTDIIGTSSENKGFGDIKHTSYGINQSDDKKFRSRVRVIPFEGKFSTSRAVDSSMNYTAGHTAHVLHASKDCDDLEHGNVHNMSLLWNSGSSSASSREGSVCDKLKIRMNMTPTTRDLSSCSSATTGLFGIKGVT